MSSVTTSPPSQLTAVAASAQPAPTRLAGIGLIVLGIGLNVPFAILGATFDYPNILRLPTAEILTRFHAGGAPLIATWYAFMAAALLLVPVAVVVHDALAPADGRRGSTALRLATVAGLLAGIVQVLGLIRWVFTVPVLARTFADPTATESARSAAVVAFESLHQYAGVALGEHLGQLGTLAWASLLSVVLWTRGGFPRWQAWLGVASAALIAVGLVEGFATVMPLRVGALGLATPVGYLGLSVWMVAVGVSFLRQKAASSLASREIAEGYVASNV